MFFLAYSLNFFKDDINLHLEDLNRNKLLGWIDEHDIEVPTKQARKEGKQWFTPLI